MALRDPAARECELFRECDCRLRRDPPEIELEDIEGRWVNEREVGCVSWEVDEVISTLESLWGWRGDLAVMARAMIYLE